MNHPSVSGANHLDIAKGRVKEALGRLLNKAGIPGAIMPTTYHDLVTGEEFRVRVSALFTVISIGARDYYFARLTGKFDGTGYGCASTLPVDCKADGNYPFTVEA